MEKHEENRINVSSKTGSTPLETLDNVTSQIVSSLFLNVIKQICKVIQLEVIHRKVLLFNKLFVCRTIKCKVSKYFR